MNLKCDHGKEKDKCDIEICAYHIRHKCTMDEYVRDYLALKVGAKYESIPESKTYYGTTHFCQSCKEHLANIDALTIRNKYLEKVNEHINKDRRRDMFAAAALTGYLANPSIYRDMSNYSDRTYIEQSVTMADAMLKAMEEK